MEKTFEELIDSEELTFTDIEGNYFEGVATEDVFKLLRQVREATIAECDRAIECNTTIELYKYEWEEISSALKSLPTDRINLKTT